MVCHDFEKGIEYVLLAFYVIEIILLFLVLDSFHIYIITAVNQCTS